MLKFPPKSGRPGHTRHIRARATSIASSRLWDRTSSKRRALSGPLSPSPQATSVAAKSASRRRRSPTRRRRIGGKGRNPYAGQRLGRYTFTERADEGGLPVELGVATACGGSEERGGLDTGEHDGGLAGGHGLMLGVFADLDEQRRAVPTSGHPAFFRAHQRGQPIASYRVRGQPLRAERV